MSRLKNARRPPAPARSSADFGKVAVLLGGDSSEREISLFSGNAVLAALGRRGVNAEGFDPGERPVQELVSGGFDRAWIALHGPGGEDGVMQGALEWLGHPLYRLGCAGLGAHHGQAQDQARGGGRRPDGSAVYGADRPRGSAPRAARRSVCR